MGCGSRFFTDWTNVDFESGHPAVQSHDLSQGIPFGDDSFDVVYHSHVLEHFTRSAGLKFIKDCYRVLKKEGILRIAVPDLEAIAKIYLMQIDRVRSDYNENTKADYEWSILEMYDQVIRSEKGGEIAKLWAKQDLPNEQWIKTRVGDEFMRFREILKNEAEARALKDFKSNKKIRFKYLTQVLNKIPWISKINTLMKMLKIARFRQSGEIHQWMYDSFSLSELLKQAGFNNIKVVDAYNSNIPNWQKYKWLDVENGKVRKPDSLFIEAVK